MLRPVCKRVSVVAKSKNLYSGAWNCLIVATQKYLFSRLSIIAIEDCYGTEPLRVVHDAWVLGRDLSKSQKNFRPHYVAFVIRFLAECPKNRETDSYLNYIQYKRAKGWLLEVPDYAKDIHTSSGRGMGRESGLSIKNSALRPS